MAVNHRTVIRSDPNYRLHNTSDMKEQSSVPKQRDSQTLENRSPLAHELEDTKRKKENTGEGKHANSELGKCMNEDDRIQERIKN